MYENCTIHIFSQIRKLKKYMHAKEVNDLIMYWVQLQYLLKYHINTEFQELWRTHFNLENFPILILM